MLLAVGLVSAVCVASASAATGFQLKLSSTRVAPGGRVTITTAPSLRCTLTITLAGRHFSHVMPYGWIQVRLPSNFKAGRVPVRVSCGGQTVTGAFSVR